MANLHLSSLLLMTSGWQVSSRCVTPRLPACIRPYLQAILTHAAAAIQSLEITTLAADRRRLQARGRSGGTTQSY